MQQRFALVAILIATAWAREARAEDLFEIQVFHARVVAPRHLDIELHSNFAPVGALVVPGGAISTKGVLYEMVEPSFGIAPGWEVAAHIQQAIRPDGRFVWGGEKLRAMTVFPAEGDAHWHFAVNVEGGYQPPRFDPAEWGLELRPVIEWTGGNFDVDFNPIVAVPFGADSAGIPQLQPALSARFLVGDLVAPSLEYYAQLGPIPRVPRLDEQRHYVFETLDIVRWHEWILHAGVGEGLTAASTRFVVTSILGRIF